MQRYAKTCSTYVPAELFSVSFQFLEASVGSWLKRALLLYEAHDGVREIFRQLPDRGEVNDYGTAVQNLHEFTKTRFVRSLQISRNPPRKH
jgi:hypothetical protein